MVTLEDAQGRDRADRRRGARSKAGGRTQWRDVASGDSYMSTHDPRPHFGLGDATVVDEIEVKWPDGTRSLRRNVPVRQHVRIKQGS